uniref:Uncharacterized protein n=1 Tax=Arundo donax TaxID=35708 RepID=A0A0A9FWJ8_ARUDO
MLWHYSRRPQHLFTANRACKSKRKSPSTGVTHRKANLYL